LIGAIGVSMTDSHQPVLRRIILGASRPLLLVGALVFCVGDKFLYEIKHMNFLVSEAVGILGGVLLMLMGAGIAVRNRHSRLE
jgi:hypothetical protein